MHDRTSLSPRRVSLRACPGSWPLVAVLVTAAACSSISTVRVQPESVYVGPHLRPIAIVHAQVTSAYFLFLAMPGHVDLDHVVNRMLLRPPSRSAPTRSSTSRSTSRPTTASGCCASCSAGAPPRRAASRSWSSRKPPRQTPGRRRAAGHQVGYTPAVDVSDRRLILVVGKGGVGRSTVAAAIAGQLRRARARRRCCSRPTRTIASVATSISRRSATDVTQLAPNLWAVNTNPAARARRVRPDDPEVQDPSTRWCSRTA